MKVAFRVDAGTHIGTGHVMRCLTLADELARQGGQCRFICRTHHGHLGDLISSRGHELRLLPVDADREGAADDAAAETSWLGARWPDDAAQTHAALSSERFDLLVADHYALDARWEQQLVETIDRIMVIDDLADRQHVCGLLLDQNLGRHPVDYDRLVPDGCTRLIGPDYALLRPEFAALRQQSLSRRKRATVKRVLVSLGGSDPANVTGEVLASLTAESLPTECELDIVLGASAPHVETVRLLAERMPFKATVSVGVADMAQRMCLADLAIGAVGSASWERFCLGLPTIMVVIAENQKAVAQVLSELDIAIIVESGAQVGDTLGRLWCDGTFEDYLERTLSRGSVLVDGMGCSRVLEALRSWR